MQYVFFWGWLFFFFLTIISLRFIQVVCVNSCFLLLSKYSTVGMCYSLFSHSPIERHLDNFQILAVKNRATMDICVQVSVNPLWQNVCACLLHILIVFFLFYFCILRVLYSTQKSFIGYVTSSYFLLVCILSFQPLTSIFHRVKVIDFEEVHFVNIFLYGLCFWCQVV